jgi:hypothetical protein
MKAPLYPLLLILIAGSEFFLSNGLLKGYLRSETYLAREVKSPVDSLAKYTLAEEPPFKYRLIFPAIVESSFAIVHEANDNRGFFNTYKFWSLVFYVCSACALYWLLQQAGFSNLFSFAGSLIFLLLPPMLMAFTLPIHTREDTLAYTLLFIGIGLLLKEKRWLFLLICLLGALTRETLLLLPLLYLLFGKDESIRRKAVITLLPVLLWIFVRFGGNNERYDMWEGLRWNLNNPEQVIGFLFITFNFLWLTFILHYAFYKRNLHFISSDLRFFYKSSLFTLVVILVTTFVGGIFNEIRLLYLFSPWMIVFFLDCLRSYGGKFSMTLATRNYRIFAAIAFVFCAALMYFVLTFREKLIEPGKYAVPYDQWVIFSVCYIFIMLLFIPHVFAIFSLKKSAK